MNHRTKHNMTCCEMTRAAHIQIVIEMKTFFYLIPRTSRNVLHFYEHLERRGLTAKAIKVGVSGVCPCRGES